MDEPLLSNEEKQEIIKALSERNLPISCPMCQETQFALIDGYMFNQIQRDLDGTIKLGGAYIPTAAIYCENCGFMSQHVLGKLGLLKKKAEQE